MAFLSTLSLRRATWQAAKALDRLCNFYPRSPCGERRDVTAPSTAHAAISIHALLAESDGAVRVWAWRTFTFLSTLSLRRATLATWKSYHVCGISIHALLAESDWCISRKQPVQAAFLSTLSLRRATCARFHCWGSNEISIHALLAESDVAQGSIAGDQMRFLSTLSLRRATGTIINSNSNFTHFYPRSPCGERREKPRQTRTDTSISIHALLAESDRKTEVPGAI